MGRFSLLLLLTFYLFSCTENNIQDDQRTVFRYNQPNSITSLDPAFARSQNNIWAIDHLYNGLVQLEEDLLVRPAIAKYWEVSEDGLTYTFLLRDDVYFHDDPAFPNEKGRRVVAADVTYSLNRIIDPAVGSPGSWIFKGKVDETNPFETVNDTTFVLHLSKPFRPMLGMLSNAYCAIVPKEALDKYGRRFRAHPVGTGPFQLKRWLENQALYLRKNPNYWEYENGQRLPYLDAVKITFIGDRKTAFLELMNGKLDFINGLESSYTNELLTRDGALRPDKAAQLQLIKAPYLNTEYLGILMQDTSESALQHKLVRQALNYGFDRQQMLQTLRNNIGLPANSGFTPRGLPSFNETTVPGYSFQPNRALQLLEDAGYPQGQGLPTIKLLTNKDYLDLCTFITKQWEDIGIKAEIDMLESATLREMMSKSQAPFFRASWIADYPDAENYLSLFYGKNPAPPNYTRFSNSEYDQLYEASLNENNDSIRFDLYQQMDRIIVDEAPVILLFYDQTARFAQKDIEGLSRNALNLLKLTRVKK